MRKLLAALWLGCVLPAGATVHPPDTASEDFKGLEKLIADIQDVQKKIKPVKEVRLRIQVLIGSRNPDGTSRGPKPLNFERNEYPQHVIKNYFEEKRAFEKKVAEGRRVDSGSKLRKWQFLDIDRPA